MNTKIFNFFFNFVITVMELLFIIVPFKSKVKYNKIEWHSTKGEITEFYMTQDSDDFCYPQIKYKYTVDSKIYTFKTLHSVDSDKYNKTPQNYYVGKIVDIYYNPENPKQACSDKHLFPSFLSLTFLTISGFILFLLGSVRIIVSIVGKSKMPPSINTSPEEDGRVNGRGRSSLPRVHG